MIGSSALRAAIINRMRRETRVDVDLAEFTMRTFPGYQMNWHHLELCRTLMRWVDGDIRRLIVSMPPRHGKSELCSIRLPAYILGRKPDAPIIACSYSARLASRMNRHVQRVIESSAYSAVFPDVRLPRRGEGVCTTGEFELAGHKGRYLSAGVGGGITGEGMLYGIIDDPVKNRKDANSPVYQTAIWDWYKSTFFTRCHKDARILVILTRWHEADLAGKLLEQDPGKWTVINIPASYKEELSTGLPDPRKDEGDPLWPGMFSKESLKDIEDTVGPFEYAALYQGDPYTDGANIFRESYWQYYTELPKFNYIEQSWDTAFKEGQENDYSVCTTWGISNTGYYLLHVYRDRCEYPKLKNMVKDLATSWRPSAILLEDKGSGTSIYQELKRSTRLPIIPVNPGSESKVERAHAAVGPIAAGRVYLPMSAPWRSAYLEELRKFPAVQHDDQTDSTTQFLKRAIMRDGSGQANVSGAGR